MAPSMYLQRSPELSFIGNVPVVEKMECHMISNHFQRYGQTVNAGINFLDTG